MITIEEVHGTVGGPSAGRRAPQQPGRGEEAGVGHHAVVGRTDWPSTCQLRCSTSSVSAMPNPLWSRASRSWATWTIDGQVGHQDPARAQGALGVLDDPPRLGQVEHDPVEPGLVDPVVDVADLDAVAVEHLLAEEGDHVGPGPVGEVLPQLVAGDHRAGPQQGHRQRPRPDAGLEDPGAGEHVGQHQDRPEVLRDR